jgi:hypothetical protein
MASQISRGHGADQGDEALINLTDPLPLGLSDKPNPKQHLTHSQAVAQGPLSLVTMATFTATRTCRGTRGRTGSGRTQTERLEIAPRGTRQLRIGETGKKQWPHSREGGVQPGKRF